MVDVSNKQNSVVIKVTGSNGNTNITATADTAQYWSKQSRLSAENSKESAQESKHYAELANSYIDGFEDVVSIGIADIETARVDAVNNITTVKSESIASVEAKGNDIVSVVNEGIAEVNTAINTGVERLNSIDALNKSQITNCLLEIPQNIKLELNNGTLTLKSGSKVIVPSGFESDGTTLKFNEVTTTKDLTLSTAGTGTDSFMIFVRYDGSAMGPRRVALQTNSGTTTPTTSYWAYYNTSTNKVDYVNSGTVLYPVSFPIAIVSTVDGATTSIDQVFNGFGYIGNTVFCDKGVKVLIPNGKNVDGSLKNIEYTTPKVITGTLNAARSNTYFCLHNNGTLLLRTDLKYNETSNYNYMDAIGNIYGVPFAIGTTTTNGVITKYKSLTNAVCLADVNKTVSKLGDTMFGTLTSEANNGSEIHIKGDDTNGWLTIKGTSSEYDYNDYANVPTENLRNLRLISYDKNNNFYFYQQVSAEKVRNICAFQVKRKLTDGTEKFCNFALRVQDTGDNTLIINGKPLQAFVTETYVNGTSWYRVWSDGWIEQGGYTNATEVTYLKAYSNENYTLTIGDIRDAGSSGSYFQVKTKTRTGFTAIYDSKQYKSWYACGY